MPNLIFAVDVDRSLIDQFSSDGLGFPDQTMLDPETGEPDSSVLEHMIGMTRAVRRREQANVKPGYRVMDFQKTSIGRLKLLLKDMYNAQQRLLKKSKSIEGFRSWERLIFNKIDETWPDPKGPVVDRFNNLSQEDQEALKGMLESRLTWVDSAKKWDAALREFVQGRSYIKQFGGLVGLLLDQLANWNAFSEEERSALADGAYAVATPFGNDLLGIFITLQPELMEHYSTLLKDEARARQIGEQHLLDEAEDDQAIGPPEVDAPLSLFGLYSELFQLAQQAKTDSGNLHYAEQIEALITANLPRLKQEYTLSEDAVRRILAECIDVLISIGSDLSLQYFQDESFLNAFRMAWLEYFNERLQGEVADSFLVDLTEERETESTDIKTRLQEAEAVTAQIESDLSNFNEKLKVANFREKSELRSNIAEAEESRVKINRQLQEVEQEGCDLLLPPGSRLETLDVDARDVLLTPGIYHPSAKAAIESWSSQQPIAAAIAEHSRPIEIEPEQQPYEALTSPTSAECTPDVEATLDLRLGEAAPEVEAKSVIEPEPEPICDGGDEGTQQPVPIQPAQVEADDDHTSEPEVDTESLAEPDEPVSPDLAEDEVNVSRFFNKPTEAIDRLEHCQQTMDVLPAIAVENIALLWLKRGHLPLASKTLEIAGRMGLAGDLLSLPLVQAAYHGMHVWRGDSATVTRVQQQLHQLSSEIIESWSYRRPGGRVVPYLVLAATLQPTLFCGMMTNASRLLASVSGSFDGPVAKLIDEVVSFSSHNIRLDVDILREQPASNDKDVREKLAARLVEWQDRIQNKQTGWAPARKAMKECLARDDFESTFQSIVRDDASRLDEVRAFADVYRDKDEQSRLMTAEIHRMMNESTAAPQIEGNARNWFLRSIDEIVNVADLWVENHSLLGQRTSEVTKFAPRLLTMLTAASAHLEQRFQSTEDPEHQAGLLLAITVLQRISRVGERHEEIIWEVSRINGWLQWPTEWLSTSTDDDARVQLTTLMELLDQGLNELALADEALKRKNFRHALLLTLNHQDGNKGSKADSIEAIKRLFLEEVHRCNIRSDQMRGLLDNANIASLIDDERHYQLCGELEHLQDQLKSLRALDDLSEIHSSLDDLESGVVNKFTAKKEQLEAALEALVNQALVDRGVDWVPATWLEQIRAALNTHDTTVAEEMLEHLKHSLDKGEPLQSDTESGTELLKRFLTLEPQLHKLLSGNHNPREVVRQLSGATVEGLSLDSLPNHFKLALEGLIDLRRRVKTLDKAAYDELVHVLTALGLEAVNPVFSNAVAQRAGFSARSRIAQLTLNVKRHDTGRGIVFFSERSDEQPINVLLGNGEWTMSELKALLTEQTQFLHDRTVFISAKELSNDERNELAKFTKQTKHVLLHVDPVLLTILAGLGVSDHQRLKTFLQLSLPWTFSNPYTGNQMQPAPPEMRYGRQNDIKSLTTMRNGAAMIFGGRQLGKTTLLNETQRRFNNPDQRHHAYLYQIDGDLDRANLSGNELDKHRYRVWQLIYQSAVSSGLVKNSYPSDADGMVDELRAYFSRDNADALMVCLDEIDLTLGLDAANGFRIFRELSGLVNNSNGRFKIVIAGLENVRRFADAPNYPLHQLGSAIQVSIMSPAEALQLIREPLGHLGYEFESPLLVNRILVETNRHPGLIHIYCHELIKTLNARHSRRVGSVSISADDVEQIRKDPGIRQLICDRFDITLNLDLRYKLIAYSLISQSTNSYSASRAKVVVQEWAPHIFGPMTDAQFEAFLDELCGLGVLQYMRRTEGGKEYALRNANILNLVGGQKDIEDKLLAAVDAINENDPLSAHAFPLSATRPSPLTLRDEKLLISEEIGEKPALGAIEARSSNYSVGIITGSEALGLDPQWMIESLLAIGEEEPPLSSNQKPGRYSPLHRRDTELGSVSEFKKLLVDVILEVQSLRKNIMLFVEITGTQPVSTMLDLLDIAHEARLNTNVKRHRVRVIFLMSPRALWQWESNPQLTQSRETMQPFIALDIWKRTALVHLLNKLNLENTSTSTDILENHSQGWYFSLDRLLAAKTKKNDVMKVDGFGPAYTPLLQAKAKSMEEFLGKTGLTAVNWARPVLSALCGQERFDEEDFAISLLCHHADIDPQQALQWLTRLRLVIPCPGGMKQNIYRLPESIKAALLIKAPQEAKA